MTVRDLRHITISRTFSDWQTSQDKPIDEPQSYPLSTHSIFVKVRFLIESTLEIANTTDYQHGANTMTNLNVRNYNEKRDFIRMKVDTEITLTLVDSKEQFTAICRDLSGKGMLIEVEQAVAEGSICDTCLPSNNDAFPGLDAQIKVLRCSPNESGEGYQLGVEILEIGM